MKNLFLSVLALAGSMSWAGTARSLVCKNADSELVLEKSGAVDEFTGKFHYNKNKDGQYGSVEILGCNTIPLDEAWVLLDCTEDSYSVMAQAFQVPKDMFSLPPGDVFSITSLSRDENTGQINGSEQFDHCSIQ